MTTPPTGPIAANNGDGPPLVRLDAKELLTIALAQDVERLQVQAREVKKLSTEPGMTPEVAAERTRHLGGRCSCVDAREILFSTTRAKPGRGSEPDTPDLLTLAVPPEVLLAVRPEAKQRNLYVMLTIIPADVAGAIAARKTTRIITPDEARMVGGAR